MVNLSVGGVKCKPVAALASGTAFSFTAQMVDGADAVQHAPHHFRSCTFIHVHARFFASGQR